MKPFVVKKDAWHYKFLKWYYSGEEYKIRYVDNFCAYWRKFTSALMLSLILFSAFITLAVICILFWKISLTLIITIVILGLISTGCTYIKDNWTARKKNTQPKESGLVATKFKSWKDKICPGIEFEK